MDVKLAILAYTFLQIYMSLYVDDILIIFKEINKFKHKLTKTFEMKYLNEVEFFLGMNIKCKISE